MTSRRALLGCGLVGLLALASRPGAAQEKTKPRESGIVESTSTRLAQLDVTVMGSKEAIDALANEDFEVKLGHTRLTGFIVDRLCGAAASPAPSEVTQAATPPPVSYLIYFDHANLTIPGRQRALDIARELIPKLVAGGSRAMIVSNARAVKTLARFTTDNTALLDAIERLENDHQEWDPYPQGEQKRMAEVMYALNKDGVERAVSRARLYYLEDRWRGERAARRLTMSLGLLGDDVDPPKAVLYFADTMRNNPGQLYLDLFPTSSVSHQSDGDLPQETNLLDGVIQEASAHGIRFYPVEAQGITAPYDIGTPSLAGSYDATMNRMTSRTGVQDAQGTLTSLALETGGAAFLNGVGSEKIVKRVLDDLRCIFLISFDPTGFPEDRPLGVVVRVHKENVKAVARGELVIQSASASRTSRLLAAFAAPDALQSEVAMRTTVIPTGWADNAFTALVQVAVSARDVPATTWDVGTSLVSRERVRDEGSGRITVSVPGVPVVFEREVRFSSGPYELVSVAQEVQLGQVGSRRDEGSWPDLDAIDAVVGPIAVVQPVNAAFLRNGRSATSGALARDEQDPVLVDRATALVGLVCRGKRGRPALRIERSLQGEARAEFPPLDVDLSQDRCALFRDLVRAGTMGAGSFRFEVRVLEKGVEIARGERKFTATSGAAAPVPGSPGPG